MYSCIFQALFPVVDDRLCQYNLIATDGKTPTYIAQADAQTNHPLIHLQEPPGGGWDENHYRVYLVIPLQRPRF